MLAGSTHCDEEQVRHVEERARSPLGLAVALHRVRLEVRCIRHEGFSVELFAVTREAESFILFSA